MKNTAMFHSKITDKYIYKQKICVKKIKSVKICFACWRVNLASLLKYYSLCSYFELICFVFCFIVILVKF